jgi:myosin heavy subunit
MERMTVEQAIEWGKTLDFPTVWAALMEDRANLARTDEQLRLMSAKSTETNEQIKRMSERSAKIDEEIKRTSDETAQKIAETSEQIKRMSERSAKIDEEIKRISARTDERSAEIAELLDGMKRRDKLIGGHGRSIGDLTETLFVGRLWEKFPQYNLRKVFRNMPIYTDVSKQVGEVDILLSDTEWAMIVEVKTTLREKAIRKHIRRMKLVHKYPLAEAKGKKILGAIACGYAPDEIREQVYQACFFLLEFSGEHVSLAEPPEGFEPKEWQ